MADEATSLEAQLACIRREIGMRKRVYPRWVANAKMAQADADREIASMQAVLATLENLRDERRAQVAPRLL